MTKESKSNRKPIEKWEREALDYNEIDMLIGACKDDTERTVITVLVYTGIRNNELIRMKDDWIDYDSEAHGLITIPIRDNVPKKDRNPHVKKRTGAKTKVKRTIPILNDDVNRVLKEWFKLHDGFDHINRQKIYRICKGVGERAGISKKVTPHQLRHTTASLMYDANYETYDIGIMLGHVDSTMCERVYIDKNHVLLRKARQKGDLKA